MTAPIIPHDTPDQVAGLVHAQEPAVRLCRDLFNGGEAIRANAKDYIPQYPGELDDNYQARKKRLYPFVPFERTVTGLNGMIYRKDPVLGDDVPRIIAGDRDQKSLGGHWENIDLAGTHGDIFCRERTQDALVDGHAAFFVDYPPVEKKLSKGEEESAGLRAYWVPVRKSQIINLRVTTENGRAVLEFVVLKFVTTQRKGRFGEKEVIEYRVYERSVVNGKGVVNFEVWEKGPDDAEPKATGRAGTISNQTEIPLVVLYGPRKMAPFVSKPPLLDLAERCIAHMQVESDEMTSLHLSGNPHPVLSGSFAEELDKTKTGPSWLSQITTESKLYYLEHGGASLAAMHTKLESLKQEEAVLGLAMLHRETKVQETAEGKRIDKSSSDSALAVLARNAQDAFESGLQFHANYQGEKDGGSIEINRDFDDQPMSSEEARALSDMVGAGTLSIETMWQMMLERDYLPADFDPNKEKTQIDARMPAPTEPEPEPAPGEGIVVPKAA